MQTILYARVSTVDQTWTISGHRLKRQGSCVSGVGKRLKKRLEGRRLFDMLRRGDTLVVRRVDRLGRNYQDVTETIRAFMRRSGVFRT